MNFVWLCLDVSLEICDNSLTKRYQEDALHQHCVLLHVREDRTQHTESMRKVQLLSTCLENLPVQRG